MRMLMNVTFPTEDFNESVRDGTVGSKISRGHHNSNKFTMDIEPIK
ncbi:MAG TPA: hypothetical protein VGJ93_15695 [Desulfuromonadaceae bacterium]|jgi:hypothetical protein